MMNKKLILRAIQSAVVASAVIPLAAQAVPSFARQTGLTCAACHTVFPQLTPFGRMFKLNGYVMESSHSHQDSQLQQDYIPPLSAMMQVSYTSQKADKDAGNQQSIVRFPQQFSFFYAGRVSDRIGIFSQITYESASDHLSADNTDIRFANHTSDGSLIYGVSLNNAPTVEDIFNTTPVWGFPALGPGDGDSQDPTAIGGTEIDTLAQTSAGVVAYGMYNGHVYGEFGAYHTANVGDNNAFQNGATLDGWAPYYRLAYTTDFGKSNVEVGLFGLNAKVYSAGMDTPTDKYDDLGIDGQYQYLNGPNTFTGRLTYTTEKFTSHSGGTADTKFHKVDLSGTYYLNRMYGGTLAYHEDKGDTNLSGDDDASWTIQADYVPWLNTRFALQYQTYTKIPSGAAYSKGDYNTLYLLGWFMY